MVTMPFSGRLTSHANDECAPIQYFPGSMFDNVEVMLYHNERIAGRDELVKRYARHYKMAAISSPFSLFFSSSAPYRPYPNPCVRRIWTIQKLLPVFRSKALCRVSQTVATRRRVCFPHPPGSCRSSLPSSLQSWLLSPHIARRTERRNRNISIG